MGFEVVEELSKKKTTKSDYIKFEISMQQKRIINTKN